MSENTKRKPFQVLPGNENPQFMEDGEKIYDVMRKKYPLNSDEHLDNILNGLCCALNCLMIENVSQDNHKNFIQLIYKILNANI